MAIGDKTGFIAWFFVAATSACNGQFDFDAFLTDSGPPIVDIEASTEDDVSNGDAVADPPRIDVNIACGATSCVKPGCCSTSAGFACADIAEGGTCGGLLIQCDDSDDCPSGQVCCAEPHNRVLATCPDAPGCEADPEVERVHCEPEAHCRRYAQFAILCNPDRPSPCTACVTSSLPGLPPGYHQCANAP